MLKPDVIDAEFLDRYRRIGRRLVKKPASIFFWWPRRWLNQRLMMLNRLARYLVRREVAKHQHLPPPEAFRAGWNRLTGPLHYRLSLDICTRFNNQHVAFNIRIYTLLANRIVGFRKTVSIRLSEGLEQLINSGQQVFLVHFHSGELFLTKALVDRGHSFVRIVKYPERHARRAARMGIEIPSSNLAPNDVSSFAKLRAYGRRVKVFCCAVDYKDPVGRFAYANPNFLEFANRLSIPIVCIKSSVDENGRPRLHEFGPFYNPDPVGCLEEFIRFHNSVGEKRLRYIVQRPGAHQAD